MGGGEFVSDIDEDDVRAGIISLFVDFSERQMLGIVFVKKEPIEEKKPPLLSSFFCASGSFRGS